MVMQDEVLSQKLKHNGLFDFKELYNFCYGWFVDEGYNLSEENYTEKVTSVGKEVVIKWKAWKKVTDYFKYVIKLDWHIIGMNDAEAEIDGKKKKMQKGDLEIKFKATIERDYETRWENGPFYKFMRGVYDNYIIKNNRDQHEQKIFNKCTSIINDVKSFLNLWVKK